MWKFLAGPAILLLYTLNAKANHLLGGDIQLLHVSGTTFSIRFHLYKDCETGADPFNKDPLQLGIFDKGSNLVMDTVLLTTQSSNTLSYPHLRCKPFNSLCVEERTYSGLVDLDPAKYNSATGYYITWERCCREGTVKNIITPSQVGQTYYMEFTAAGVASGNSSPEFRDEPLMFICYNQLFKYSYNVLDADGDSLVYSLTTPLVGNTSPSNLNCDSGCPPPVVLPGPYAQATWSLGYGLTRVIDGVPTLGIVANTGELTSVPSAQGKYVMAVKVEEFRNGVKIGEARREQMLFVLVCPVNSKPAWVPPTPANFEVREIEASEELCIKLRVEDADSANELNIKLKSDLVGLNGVKFTSTQGNGTLEAELCLKNTCDYSRINPYILQFIASDNGCPDQDSIFLDMSITVTDPIKEFIEKIPNVFTPNDDEFNDYFAAKVRSSGCEGVFSIAIFNRWGIKMFGAENPNFSWDGKDAAEGIYYYVIDYAGKPYTGSLTILR